MSTVYYNGVQLQVTRTLACQRRMEFDGPTYKWTRWRIHVQAVYNPRVTSYNLQSSAQGPRPDLIAEEAGNNPAFTDSIIRHRLAQPRKKLVYTAARPPLGFAGATPNVNLDGYGDVSGPLTILDCPPSLSPTNPNFSQDATKDRYRTDANNGPTPFLNDLRPLPGGVNTKTWFVDWAVEACVSDCLNYYSNPTPIVSQRWRMAHDIDRLGYCTRITTGHAVFRTDVLLATQTTPDQYRAALLHPIPTGFRREKVRAVAHEDGNRIDYTFQDVEQGADILQAGVADIRARWHISKDDPSWEERIFGGGRAWRAGNLLAALRGGLGTQEVSLVIEVWGNRSATKRSLSAVAHRVLQIKFPQASGRFGVAYDLSGDMMERYVRLRVVYRAPPFTASWEAMGGQLANRYPELFDDDIGEIASAAARVGKAPVGASDPANKGARGTYLANAVAEALQESCQKPDEPGEPGRRELVIPAPAN
jgi:hypothetical protein